MTKYHCPKCYSLSFYQVKTQAMNLPVWKDMNVRYVCRNCGNEVYDLADLKKGSGMADPQELSTLAPEVGQ